MKKISLLSVICFTAFTVKAQLFIDNSILQIQAGATVTVQGDVTSNVDILGPGKVLLAGSSNQNITMNGFTIPNLEMNNTANATLLSNARIGTNLNFLNGKIILGNFNMKFASIATGTGGGTSNFIETTGTGQAQLEVAADIPGGSPFTFPVGSGTDYMPLSVSNTGSAYASAIIGVQNKGVADPNKHPRTESYLTTYWPLTKTGITGGTTNAVGTYVDPTRIIGTETDLRGIYWDGTNWSLAGGSQDANLNTAGANATANSGEIYAMNKFVLANMKAFLQAPYNTGTSLMDDKLRNSGAYVPGTLPASNLLPLTDPYRTITFSTSFPHVSNATVETIASSVLNDQVTASKNVVDWVFLELRNTVAPPTTVQQTRSALLLRDGSIVDVDGVSPVYFKNVDAGTFNIAVRHRNHLGLRTNAPTALALLSSPATVDLTNNANTLSNFGALLTAGVYGMYAGNVNLNTNIRISGASPALSDFEQLKAILGALPLISNVYSEGDVNMNRTVRISGASPTLSDYEYIKSVLGVLPIINQPVH